MTDEANNATRQQILEAVVTCIEKYGIDSLTTRKIAEEAGTNIASINYYFRTKDRLVDEALSMTVQHMLEDVCALIEQPEQPFEQMLDEVLFYLIEGSLRFPGTSLAHIYSIMVEKRYDTTAAQAFHQIFGRLAARTAQEYPNAGQAAIGMALSQVLAAVLFSMLAPGLFLPLASLDLSQSQECRRLARYLTRLFVQAVEVGQKA